MASLILLDHLNSQIYFKLITVINLLKLWFCQIQDVNINVLPNCQKCSQNVIFNL